jgi:DivIVA domain-containing protein
MAEADRVSPQVDEQGWASQSSDLIRFKQFVQVRKGYEQEEVREYLAQVATWFDEAKHYLGRLERERRELLAQREALLQTQVSGDADPYQQFAARMADVLRAVDQHAQTLRREVDDEATRRTHEAEQQAESIRSEAEAEAGQVRQEADRFAKEVRARAEELLGRLTSHRMVVRDELQRLLERTKRIVGQMESQIGTLEEGAEEREPAGQSTAFESTSSMGEDSESGLSYASDDLLIVLPDLVPTVDEQEEDRS